MNDHPIQGLMQTAMENIKEMVDVNTIVGDAVETPDGSVIIPISRVSFGFAAGGGQYNLSNGGSASGNCSNNGENTENEEQIPFGGGSGGGVSIKPVAFLVVGNGDVRLLSADSNSYVERIIDTAPHLLQQIQAMFDEHKGEKNAPAQNQQCTKIEVTS